MFYIKDNEIESLIDKLACSNSLTDKIIIEKFEGLGKFLYKNNEFGLLITYLKDENRGKCCLSFSVINGDTHFDMSDLVTNHWRENYRNFSFDVHKVVGRLKGKFDKNGKMEATIVGIGPNNSYFIPKRPGKYYVANTKLFYHIFIYDEDLNESIKGKLALGAVVRCNIVKDEGHHLKGINIQI